MKHAVPLPLSQLTIDQHIHNLFPRHSDESYADLKDSIERSGMLSPLCVGIRGDRYIILDGETRFHIAKELHYEHLRCDICENPLEELEATFLNVHRRQLTPTDQANIKKQEQEWAKAHLHNLDPSILAILKDFEAQRFLPKHFFWKLRTYSTLKQQAFAKDLEQTLRDYRRTLTESQPLSTQDVGIAHERNTLSKKCLTLQETIHTLEDQVSSLERTLTTERESHNIVDALSGSRPLRATASDSTHVTLQVHTILDASIPSLLSQLTTIKLLVEQSQHAGITINNLSWERLLSIQDLIENLLAHKPDAVNSNGTRKLALVAKHD